MYGPKWPCLLMYLSHEIDVGTTCSLGRAPRTKETLPDFHEWCRVTRHPRLFRRLTGCQRTPRFWGVTLSLSVSPSVQSVSNPPLFPQNLSLFIPRNRAHQWPKKSELLELPFWNERPRYAATKGASLQRTRGNHTLAFRFAAV